MEEKRFWRICWPRITLLVLNVILLQTTLLHENLLFMRENQEYEKVIHFHVLIFKFKKIC